MRRMARPIRVEYEDAVYHVMARGNEQRAIYRDPTDYQCFLQTLARACQQYGLVVHVYCLMPNHYHLALQTPRANLSRALGWLQTTYSIRFNRRHRRNGHLFQGRFKAQLVEADAYARRLVTYIHLNPVHPRGRNSPIPADKREQLQAHPWSSHWAYSGRRKRQTLPPWLSLEWLWYFGRNYATARRAYRRDIAESFSRRLPDPFAEARGGLVLGGDELWQRAKQYIGKGAGQEEIRWSHRASQEQVLEALAPLLETELDQRVRIWARVRLGGQRLVDVARECGYRDGSGVHRILQRLEARADGDPSLAAKLKRLQRKVQPLRPR